MNLQKFMKKYNVSSAELISFLREHYPNYGKPVHCMISHPERYGIRLTSQAEKLIKEKYAPSPEKKKVKSKTITIKIPEKDLYMFETMTDETAAKYISEKILKTIR